MPLSLKKGSRVVWKDETYEILNPTGPGTVLARNVETGKTSVLPIGELSAPKTEEAAEKTPNGEISEGHWKIAKERYAAIEPLLVPGRTREMVERRAEESGVSAVTLFRWIRSYSATGTLSSLVPDYLSKGGKGKPRTEPDAEKIMNQVIEENYLSKQRLPVTKIYTDIKIRCSHAGITPPSENTVRNRIKAMDHATVYRRRHGRSAYLNSLSPAPGSFEAKFPLEIIQVDHTPLDIIVVDEIYRKPLKRPYLTLAMDIYSRMVYGFYLTFEAPSFFSVGQTLYMGITPKATYLKAIGVDGEWPIYGLPKFLTIHLDNAAEFRGNALKRFCEEYNIGVDFRPRGAPYYGGHIERLVKTMNFEIHTLPGTTFSNVREKGDYGSEGKAVFTLKELEKWLAEYIVNVYHKKVHSELGMPPEKKYEIGILGNDETAGTGLPDLIDREEAERIRISLLPFTERTVQKDGVSFENIKYYADVLRKYIGADGPGKKGKTYTFRYDPRDISALYFYEPELKAYFSIPYRNMGNPAVTLWEIKKAKNRLKEEGFAGFDETRMFQAIKKLRHIETESAEKTKSARRKLSSDVHYREKKKIEVENGMKLKPAAYGKRDDGGSGVPETDDKNTAGKEKNPVPPEETENKNKIETYDIDVYD